MFAFVKNLFCHEDESCKARNKERDRLEKKLKAAHEQDRQVRESLTEKQIDTGLKDTMAASDPVAKY